MNKVMTIEELRPSEKALAVIRQFAYTYKEMRRNGRPNKLCLS